MSTHATTKRISGRVVEFPADLCNADRRKVPHRAAFIRGAEAAGNGYGTTTNPYPDSNGGRAYRNVWLAGFEAWRVGEPVTVAEGAA